ncbi:MAG: rod shape-determining protein [Chitinivibrionia bacterium]|nr:rod shape-determining protein [Chitinivibrionia bacterium]
MGFFSFGTTLGIDLGTANTLVYAKNRGLLIDEPSVVAIDRSTNEVLEIGTDAKKMLGRTPGKITAVRPMRDGVIADIDLVEEMLRYFVQKVQPNSLFKRTRAVMGVPSGITKAEQRAVLDCAERAGIIEARLIAEPMAAAIGMDVPILESSGNMIIDIGGGTSEISVISMGGMVCDLSEKVGGDQFDRAIVEYMKKSYNLLIGESTAEEVKKRVGSAFELPEELEMEVRGHDIVAGIPRELQITSVEIREALKAPVDEIIKAVLNTLEKTPPELSSDILDKGIIMTGGSSLLRGLDERIRRETNLPVCITEDPLTRVARGALIVAENLQKYSQVLFGSSRNHRQ